MNKHTFPGTSTENSVGIFSPEFELSFRCLVNFSCIDFQPVHSLLAVFIAPIPTYSFLLSRSIVETSAAVSQLQVAIFRRVTMNTISSPVLATTIELAPHCSSSANAALVLTYTHTVYDGESGKVTRL